MAAFFAPAAKRTATRSSLSMEFANGLVGSDVEAPEFDPFQLSAGRSEETLNWYRAAELKVNFSYCSFAWSID